MLFRQMPERRISYYRVAIVEPWERWLLGFWYYGLDGFVGRWYLLEELRDNDGFLTVIWQGWRWQGCTEKVFK